MKLIQKFTLVGFLLVHLGSTPFLIAQSTPQAGVDVIHYRFDIHLSDTSNQIQSLAALTVNFKRPINRFLVDLTGQKPDMSSGMKVTSVSSDHLSLSFTQRDEHLIINLPDTIKYPFKTLFTIRYHGIPDDGLIISTNKFGQRTFFGDNWPDRAHHWLACIDHPSDKATVEFQVTAPSHYKVVSNGQLIGLYSNKEGFQTTCWKETAPLPTKVMVIGVADFAVQNAGSSDGIPVQTWVYNKNYREGFTDYAPAVQIMDYYQQLLGPYAYEKLANVQAKTIYGGMENSSCIFYNERSVNGKNQQTGLLAHEIAHQWFGDAVTEKEWAHIWLSEGFATYIETCYSTYHKGEKLLASRMARARSRVISYYHHTQKPVIDTTETHLMRLLNTNSYQKGAWVLHMLRNQLGDETFWNGIRRYYAEYKNKNALTGDFQRVMEEVSHRDLSRFFYQWLEIPGHPQLKIDWSYNKSDKQLDVTVHQTQTHYIFSFPLELKITGKDGRSSRIVTIEINSAETTHSFSFNSKPLMLEADPRTVLLFEQ
ncbi:MAG: hypothetical protein J7L89_10080 [Bacteroidales bacterium]|nr:hypothetical protein [Bacteroidales bacterium]